MSSEGANGRTTDVQLSPEQVRYMADSLPLPAALVAALRLAPGRSIRLTTEQRSQLMAAVSTRLQSVGFDKDYAPTREGMLLESIIDVLTSTT